MLLDIAGYGGSTNVASLLPAFESLNISATLPALKTSLLNSTALKSKRRKSSMASLRRLTHVPQFSTPPGDRTTSRT